MQTKGIFFEKFYRGPIFGGSKKGPCQKECFSFYLEKFKNEGLIFGKITISQSIEYGPDDSDIGTNREQYISIK